MVSLDTEKIKDRVVSGITFYLGARAERFVVERFVRKSATKYADLVGPGAALVLDLLDLEGMVGSDAYEYIEPVIDGMSDFGLYRFAEIMVEKKPVVWFQDANTLRVLNLNPSAVAAANVTVYIDGVQVTPSAVSGTADDLTISLPAPVQGGKHEVTVVADTGKAAYNPEAYV